MAQNSVSRGTPKKYLKDFRADAETTDTNGNMARQGGLAIASGPGNGMPAEAELAQGD